MTHSREEKLGKLPEGGDTGAGTERREQSTVQRYSEGGSMGWRPATPEAKEGNPGAELEDRMEGKRTPGDSQFPSLNSNDSRIIYAEIW